MPRLRRSDKRKHELTIDVRNVLAHVWAYGDPAPWVAHWGGPAEARAAFEALRHHHHATLGNALGVQDAETYDAWLARIAAAGDAADAPDPDEAATPWRNGS